MQPDEAVAVILADADNERFRTQWELTTLANHARLLPTVISEDLPEFEARLHKLIEQAEIIRNYNHAEDLISDSLAAVGVDVVRLEDLLEPHVGNSHAVPVLVAALAREQQLVLRLKLVQALGMPWSTEEAIAPLLAEFSRARDEPGHIAAELRNAIPQSIERVANDRWFDQLLTVIRDPASGHSRYFFVRALRKMRKRKHEVVPELLSYLASGEGDLYIPAARLLGRWRVYEAAPAIRELLQTIEDRPPYPATGAWSRSFERAELRKAVTALDGR